MPHATSNRSKSSRKITITPLTRPDGTRVACVDDGLLHAVYSLRGDGNLRLESGNLMLAAEEQIAASLADDQPREITPQLAPRSTINAARQGICPHCHSYCDGDCQA